MRTVKRSSGNNFVLKETVVATGNSDARDDHILKRILILAFCLVVKLKSVIATPVIEAAMMFVVASEKTFKRWFRTYLNLTIARNY